MNDINVLADKIEQAISKMFAHIADKESGVRDYALLFNSKISKYWVVVLFFNDKVQLKNSLANKFCYSMYQFLQNEILLIDKNLPINIRFDTGQYPSNETEYEQLLEKHIVAYDTVNNEKGQSQICHKCGHDWGKHKLHRIGNVLEGWVTCPDEDCFCFMTWDTPITEKNK